MTSRSNMCVVWLLALFLSNAWTERAHAEQAPPAAQSKGSACTASPIAPGQPWSLEYSFDGGMMPGTGTVNLLLSSDGRAVVTVKHYKKKANIRTVTLPLAEIGNVTETLTKWPPSCIHTVLRQDYALYDFGQYSLKFTSGPSSSTALFDECHVADNVDGFKAIYNAIQHLAPYLGKEITWSSGASIRVKGDMCAPKGEAPNQSSKRTREKPRAA